MFLRTLFATFVGCVCLIAPIAAAAERGPSTPDERKQVIELIHAWQANPLGPEAKDHFATVLKFFADVPDMTVHVCMILDKLPKGDKKDGNTIFGGAFMGQAAFVIENVDKKADPTGEYQAGTEGALRVYELLLKANPKDRESYLDDLIERREHGTLADFVKERSLAACKN
jgi:hypothetical protein